MVNDEPRCRAEAPRSESLAVPVAGQDEDVHARSGGHDLAFDAPAAGLGCGRAPEPRLRFREQFRGGLLGDRPHRFRGCGRRCVSSQQTAASGAGDCFGLGARDMEQRDLRVGRQELCRLCDGDLPGVLVDPDERSHTTLNLQR